MIDCRGYVFNLTLVVSALYSIYYTLLEPFAGLSWSIILGLPLMWSSNILQQHVQYAWAIALVVHILGWFMQVPIHPTFGRLASLIAVAHASNVFQDEFLKECQRNYVSQFLEASSVLKISKYSICLMRINTCFE